jgi:DNA modification methylase
MMEKAELYKLARRLGSFPEPMKIIRTHRYPDNILDFPNPPRRGSLHPAQKSLQVCQHLIETYSLPGDLVLDNCAGSGTTLLAAETLGRRWIGIEKEVKYCDEIRSRFERYSTETQDTSAKSA